MDQTIIKLNDDIYGQIIGELDVKGLIACQRVSRTFNRIVLERLATITDIQYWSLLESVGKITACRIILGLSDNVDLKDHNNFYKVANHIFDYQYAPNRFIGCICAQSLPVVIPTIQFMWSNGHPRPDILIKKIKSRLDSSLTIKIEYERITEIKYVPRVPLKFGIGRKLYPFGTENAICDRKIIPRNVWPERYDSSYKEIVYELYVKYITRAPTMKHDGRAFYANTLEEIADAIKIIYYYHVR